MSPHEDKRLEAVISGRVQGVGFRYFTTRCAGSIGGITGWVKNEPDGTVRLVAEGDAKSLEQLLEKVQKGPTSARVNNVDLEWKQTKDEFNSFGVRY